MTRTGLAVAMIVIGGLPATAAEVPALSRVEAVTVFPSGAEVSRIAKVKLEPGQHTLIVNDLPADAIQSSIRVEGRASAKLEIGSVDTRSLMVPRTDQQASQSERRRIEDEIENLRDQRGGAEAQMLAAETQKTLIANLAQLPTRPAPAHGAEKSEDWGTVLTTIFSASGEAQRLLLEAQVKLRTLDRQIEDLEKKLASLAAAEEARTEVRVSVEAGAPLDADIVVRYQVPNASWRALYDARLATGNKTEAPKLTIARRAEISQSTGEAWDNVALTLSTTRPTAGASAPDLWPMTVDFELPPPPPSPVATAPMTRMEAQDAAKPMAAPESDMALGGMAEEKLKRDVVEQSANVAVAPFQAVFAVPGRVAVANTGEAKKVQLVSESMEPVLSVRTVPKADSTAYLYAKLVLPQGTPLLPGPVSLFRDGTFVGTGNLPVLSPGEEHELGFGIDDLVRVKHAVVEEKRGETGLISTSRTDSRTYKLTIKNMHERAIPVTVLDQVPVAANQDIKVEMTGKSRATKENVDDKRGVLSWTYDLEADQEQVIDFGYRVSWPAAKQIMYR